MTEFTGGVVLAAQHFAIERETDAHAFGDAHVGEAVHGARRLGLQPEPCGGAGDGGAFDVRLHPDSCGDGRSEIDVAPAEAWRIDEASRLAIDHSREHETESQAALLAMRHVRASSRVTCCPSDSTSSAGVAGVSNVSRASMRPATSLSATAERPHRMSAATT